MPDLSADSILDALDPEQRAVATSLGGPVAVIAGAGTGKTRAITHRIAYGVRTGVYDPRAVLAVTFTTRAAGEMRGRLRALGAPTVAARTFHSAALRQLQYFWPRAYRTDVPRVADNRMGLVADAAQRQRLRVDQTTLRDLVGEVSWAKVSNVTVGDYVAAAERAGRAVGGVSPAQVARLLAGYEEVKRERGVIDFDDILLCMVALLSDVPEVAAQVRSTYRHLIVDEYQDVSPLQHLLLTLWRGTSDDICVVGDPAQTIHSFAGARSSYLTSFAAEHPGATVLRLVRDYRSTPQVVQVANRIIKAQGSTVSLLAQRPDGPAPAFAEAPSENAEAQATAAWLDEQHAHVDWADMAVLYRINAQSPALEAALAERDIPYLVRGAERFYERAEVRQALIALRVQAATAPGEPGLEAVRGVLGGLGWTPTPPGGGGAVRERWESWSALASLAEELNEDAAELTFAEIVAEFDHRAEAQHAPTAQGVTLSTLHAAKGLEWAVVNLYGTHEGSVPFVLATGPEQIAEERRLLYVGVTRARERLRISWARTRNGGGATRSASRFLDGIRPGDTSSAHVRTPRARRSAVATTCRVCRGTLSAPADRKLGRHAGCPSSYDEATLARLKLWRKDEAAAQKLPGYCVFTDATLIAIAEARPTTERDLLAVQGVGAAKLGKYGAAVLGLIEGPHGEHHDSSDK